MAKTQTYKCLTNIRHNGDYFKADSAIDLSPEDARPLLEINAIEELRQTKPSGKDKEVEK